METETFKIILVTKVRQGNDLYYVEYVPDNEYDDDVKAGDTTTQQEIDDLTFQNSKRILLYDLLEDMHGTEFTDKYSL
jgi:hypothetical protein